MAASSCRRNARSRRPTSSRRSRRVGSRISKPRRRCSSGARNRPWATEVSRSASVAATTRTSTRSGASDPTGWISPLSSARSRRTCTSGDASPTSSRKRVPTSARSKWPARRRSAPVKAPRAAPKSSAAASAGGTAPRLSAR